MEIINPREAIRGIKTTPEEANQALTSLFALEKPQLPLHPTKILIASNSRSKTNLLTKLCLPLGIEVLQPTAEIPEKDYQQALQQLGTSSEKYAPRLSAKKLLPFEEIMATGVPAIGFDTVVIDQGKILEKPTSLDEARATITNLLSKRRTITVSDGVTLGMATNPKEPFFWRSVAEISFTLNEATQKQINDYIEQQGDKLLDIAGGVDFSSEIGRQFINTTVNPAYMITQGKTGSMPTPNSTFDTNRNFAPQVYMAESASSVLDPYFKGVPVHLVKNLLGKSD